MPPCHKLMAQPERGPRWDCRDVSPQKGWGPPDVSPHPAEPGCSCLPQFTPGDWLVWECPENLSRCGVGGVFRSEKPLVAASGSHGRYLGWRGGDTGHRLPGSSGAEVGELCWVVVSLRWGWGAGAGAEQLRVLWGVSRIWVADTKLHPSHPTFGPCGLRRSFTRAGL